MVMRVYTVGGYSEVGRNMTVLEYEEDAFIFDNGLFLPAIVGLVERENVNSEKSLKKIGALANDSVIAHLKDKIRAQFIGHGHLDHVGGFPYNSDKYNAPIYGTPFTMEILKSLLTDNDVVLKNKLYSVKPNGSFYVKGKNRKYKVDFISMTHSILQTVMIALHTPKGVFLYSLDFKIDNAPVYNNKPNYKKLKEIKEEGVVCCVIDALYADTERKTPGEKIAKALLKEVLIDQKNDGDGLVVTSFSSHIERLKSIVEYGKKLNREVVFLGRSLDKYCKAAQNVGLASFLNNVKIAKYRTQVERTFSKVEKNRSNYMVVCTGHQGEPGSILERLSRHDLPFRINRGDNIVFSSSVIPTDVNREQFKKMENRLKKSKPRIFRDVHVSGHAGREDLRDFIRLIKPEHVIPSHGGPVKNEAMMNLLVEMGYKRNKNAHYMENGGVLTL